MSYEVGGGGDQALGALTEKGPKRQKGLQSVCKKWRRPKKQHNVCQKGPFLEISGPPRSLPRDEISGARGPVPRFLQPWSWLHESNVIFEDQLTHNFMPKSARTTQGRNLRRRAKCEQKMEMTLF